MTVPTFSMTATESLFESDPALVAGYLADTARRLDVRLRDSERLSESRQRNAEYFSERVDSANRLRNDRESEIDNFIDALKSWADSEGVDSDFDDVLDRFGFERRERVYEVTVSRYRRDVERATVRISATSEDAASELAESQYRYGSLDADWETDDYSTEYDTFEVDEVNKSDD